MNTFYCIRSKDKGDYVPTDWHSDNVTDENRNNLIKISDPLTIEYKRFHIVSKSFDFFGKSEVMIVSHIRNAQRKERSMENIVYSDEDVKPKKVNGRETFSIGPFDTSKYGHPIFLHTPGYQGTVITVTTKMWELDQPSKFTDVMKAISSGLGLIEPLSPYFVIVDKVLNIATSVISGTIHHDELAPPHTIELRMDDPDHPLLTGKYVCIPYMSNLTSKYDLLDNYYIEDNLLVDADYNEYPHTYFIIEISKNKRDDLADFDFTASSADLLTKLQRGVNDKSSDELIKINRDSYDYTLIQLIKDSHDKWIKSEKNSGVYDQATALYKQLRGETKKFFDENFPSISQDFS